MSYKSAEAKAVSASFQSFLWSEIKSIREAEKEGDILTALNLACSLVKYLPMSVKKELEEDVKRIAQVVNRNFVVEGSDFQSTMLLRNKRTGEAAQLWLKQFVAKLMQLLDERGVYMEYKRKDVETGQEISIS